VPGSRLQHPCFKPSQNRVSAVFYRSTPTSDQANLYGASWFDFLFNETTLQKQQITIKPTNQPPAPHIAQPRNRQRLPLATSGLAKACSTLDPSLKLVVGLVVIPSSK
jgi:hypothetical protein